MSSKKHLDDIDDITEKPKTTEGDQSEVEEESCASLPQHKGAMDELIRQKKIISEMTGEPVRPPFSRQAVVSGTRRSIGELPNSQAGRMTPKKNPVQSKPDRPKRKL